MAACSREELLTCGAGGRDRLIDNGFDCWLDTRGITWEGSFNEELLSRTSWPVGVGARDFLCWVN